MSKWLEAAKRDAGREVIQPQRPEPPPVLSVASALSEGGWPAPSRAHGLEPDPSAYLDLLRHHGPATYGAMADALGRRATRAWQAETRRKATGQASIDKCGNV